MENRKHATGEAMNTEPILCSGDDLDSVIAGIRERGGFVASLETGVGKLNAQYRVNYFERGDTPDDGSSSKDKQQVSENHSGKVATVPGLLLQDAGRARNAMTRKASGVCAEPAALNPLNAGKEPTTSADKSPKGLDQITPEEITCHNPQSGVGRQTESRVEDCHQHSLSIESRMTALQEYVMAKVELRAKKYWSSRNKNKEARLPYRDA